MNLLNVGLVEETGGILVVLRAPALARLLVIETGLTEGQAIALEASGVRSERPLTQDLLSEAIRSLGARVREIQIREFKGETFYATVVLDRLDGAAPVEVDARPSDAIALAMRAGAPILVADSVMAEVGIPEDRNGRLVELYEEEAEEDGGEKVVH